VFVEQNWNIRFRWSVTESNKIERLNELEEENFDEMISKSFLCQTGCNPIK